MEIVAAFIGMALVIIAAGIVLEWKAGLLRDWRARDPDYPSALFLAHPRPRRCSAAGALGCTGPLAQEVR